MDVFHLARHVFAGYQIRVPCSALASTGCLSTNHNPETLLGGIGRTRLCTSPVNPCGCGTPASRNRSSCHGRYEGRTGLNGVASSEAFSQFQVTVEGHLRASVFRQDPGEWNGVFPEGALVFLAIDVACDFCVVATFGQDFGVQTDFSLRLWSASEEVFEVQLDETIWSVRFEETALVFSRQSNGTDKFTGALVAVHEFAFR